MQLDGLSPVSICCFGMYNEAYTVIPATAREINRVTVRASTITHAGRQPFSGLHFFVSQCGSSRHNIRSYSQHWIVIKCLSFLASTINVYTVRSSALSFKHDV